MDAGRRRRPSPYAGSSRCRRRTRADRRPAPSRRRRPTPDARRRPTPEPRRTPNPSPSRRRARPSRRAGRAAHPGGHPGLRRERRGRLDPDPQRGARAAAAVRGQAGQAAVRARAARGRARTPTATRHHGGPVPGLLALGVDRSRAAARAARQLAAWPPPTDTGRRRRARPQLVPAGDGARRSGCSCSSPRSRPTTSAPATAATSPTTDAATTQPSATARALTAFTGLTADRLRPAGLRAAGGEPRAGAAGARRRPGDVVAHLDVQAELRTRPASRTASAWSSTSARRRASARSTSPRWAGRPRCRSTSPTAAPTGVADLTPVGTAAGDGGLTVDARRGRVRSVRHRLADLDPAGGGRVPRARSPRWWSRDDRSPRRAHRRRAARPARRGRRRRVR